MTDWREGYPLERGVSEEGAYRPPARSPRCAPSSRPPASPSLRLLSSVSLSLTQSLSQSLSLSLSASVSLSLNGHLLRRSVALPLRASQFQLPSICGGRSCLCSHRESFCRLSRLCGLVSMECRGEHATSEEPSNDGYGPTSPAVAHIWTATASTGRSV